MVSDEMIDTHRLAYTYKCNDGNSGTKAVLKYALQSAINAAWPKFDAEDPETWPQTEGLYLCMFDIGKLEIWGFKTELAHTWHLVQRYCDIADILPEGL